MAEKEMRNFALRDENGNEIGVFTGKAPRQAALKAANRGYTDIKLRERGTKKVHIFTGERVQVDKPKGAPAWIPDKIWKPVVKKVGVEKLDENIETKNIKIIADAFADRFSHWKITIRDDDLKDRRRGDIHQAGWLIQYCFGKNDAGEYMDYYATHRMTDDSHVRIHENGRIESLPTLNGWLLSSEDPIEAKRLKNEYDRHNREVTEMLIDKGFNKFTINMALCAGLDEEITKK